MELVHAGSLATTEHTVHSVRCLSGKLGNLCGGEPYCAVTVCGRRQTTIGQARVADKRPKRGAGKRPSP